jgi:hypothetical protein
MAELLRLAALDMGVDERMEEQRAALPFLEAAARQLAHQPEAREQLAALLRLAQEGASTGGPQRAAEQMAGNPVLLSVVFQNIDLLYAHDYPGADALSTSVMSALEQLEMQP